MGIQWFVPENLVQICPQLFDKHKKYKRRKDKDYVSLYCLSRIFCLPFVTTVSLQMAVSKLGPCLSNAFQSTMQLRAFDRRVALFR